MKLWRQQVFWYKPLYHPASSADTNLPFGFFQPIQSKESKIGRSVADAAIFLA
jgi:hypothetical protein